MRAHIRDGRMVDDTAISRTDLEVASVELPARRMVLRDVMVDTGSEYSWIQKDVLLAAA